MFEVKPVDRELLPILNPLFEADPITNGCWCCWFVVSVKDYEMAGTAGNRSRFCEMVAIGKEPVGMVALREGVAVGWCAVGPRARYSRGLRIPTYRGRDPAEDQTVWLVPCFFVQRDARGQGVGRALLEGAVATAGAWGAQAVEGFPFSGSKRRSSGDVQVGVEPMFVACGFTAVRRPTPNRVVMRRELR